MTLDQLYENNCNKPSDINEHLPVLLELAKECEHITEFGTRHGVSTSAFLYSGPKKLICYDVAKKKEVDELEKICGDTEFIFYKTDVLNVEIESTDMLFIDTWHAYIQLIQELRLHSDKAKKYIVLHDTEKFSRNGDTCKGTRDPQGGLMDALDEFLNENKYWRVLKHYENNNGLTILERV